MYFRASFFWQLKHTHKAQKITTYHMQNFWGDSDVTREQLTCKNKWLRKLHDNNLHSIFSSRQESYKYITIMYFVMFMLPPYVSPKHKLIRMCT
jgi:hypothetical protein